MTVDQNRVLSGVPAGGQFAAQTHTEPDLRLGGADPDHKPAADMAAEEIREWVSAQVSHHISPVIGWIRRDAAEGEDTSGHGAAFHERAARVADDVAAKFSSTPPGLAERADASRVIRGVIEEDLNPVVANALSKLPPQEQRFAVIAWRSSAARAAERLSGKLTAPAPMLDGFTAEQVEAKLALDWHQHQCACDRPGGVCRTYGAHWQDRACIPNVHAVFDALTDMAAARTPTD